MEDKLFVISEEQLNKMTSWATNKGVCLYEQRLTVAKEVRSHPLSDHDAELKCKTCGGIVNSPKCDRCYANNIANIKEEIKRKERELVLSQLDNFNMRTDAEVARKERERVLDELKYWVRELPTIRTRRIPTDEETYWIGYDVVAELLESLRGEP